MQGINERIRRLRRFIGLKQRELAERLSVPTSTVGGWECGSVPPSKLRIYQICKEFGVRQEWLEDGAGEMFEGQEVSVVAASDALREAAIALFAELSPKGQSAVLQALRDYLKERGFDVGGDGWK